MKLVLALGILSLVGCGSKELTRAKARELIEKSEGFKAKTQLVPIEPTDANTLVKRSYAKWVGVGLSNFVLTQEGQNYFIQASGQRMMFGISAPVTLGVMPIQATKRKVIDITGITGEGLTRAVEYTWKWDPLRQPKEVMETIFARVPINSDVAQFKLYDDGWRLLGFGPVAP